MLGKIAKKAIKDVIEVDINEKHSQELYNSICEYLMNKDSFFYIEILRFKHSLHAKEFNRAVIDYFVMEFLLEKMQKKYPLMLSTLTYLIVCKS